MKRLPSQLRGQRGFTLVELMIAMTLTTILIAMALQVAVIVIDGYRRHREATGIERSARSSIDIISDAVRNGSAGVPGGDIVDAAGCTGRGVLEVVNSSSEPDELYVTSATGGIVTSVRDDFEEGDTTITVLDAAGLSEGELVLVTDFQKGHIVRVDGTPTENSDDWTVPVELTGCGYTFHYTRGAMLLRVRVSHFYVDDLDGVPTLFLDADSDGPDAPEPLAEGIEDFQIAVGVDVDGNGEVLDEDSDDDEWFYNVAGDDDPPTVVSRPWRALRLTVTARATREDIRGDWSMRPDAEDRTGTTAEDGYRRRSVTAVVEIRNLEGSP